MKFVVLLGFALVASATFLPSQARRFRRSHTGSDVDGTNGGSEYHYSWLHDGRKEYEHSAAVGYCKRLGGAWRPISIESSKENSFVNGVISSNGLDYIWTGGVKSGSGWKWTNGGEVTGINWSSKGGRKVPQPDNREGNENCLAILNNFYKDGIKWHDVACHHPKPIICERSR